MPSLGQLREGSTIDETRVNGSGIYGLRLKGLSLQHFAVPAPAAWHDWTVEWRHHDGPAQQTLLDGDSAVLQLLPDGFVEISRQDATTTFHSLYLPDADRLAHPHLAGTAVLAAHWRGDLSFHAGGFVVGGAVWGVLGARESGKSTTLAWAAQLGLDVWTDDLVVVRGATALAGPRCLDLRESAHEHFGLGVDIGVVGTRQRWRVDLNDLPASELPLRGWVVLGWADEVSVTSVHPRERLQLLADHRALQVQVDRPNSWLQATALPMLRLSRPKDWKASDEALASLLSSLTAYESPSARPR